MAESLTPGNIEAHIQGEIIGQVAVGSYVLRVGSMHGGLVNAAAPGAQVLPRRRPLPVRLLPAAFDGLLDREAELAEAAAALAAGRSIQFYGPAGIGKTSLLRRFAQGADTRGFPDGIIYLSVPRQPLADVLQSIFDLFYDCDVTFKPSDAQLRQYLQDIRAAILLDDMELTRDEAEDPLKVMPSSVFLLASSERIMWGDGQAVALQGLPLDAAMQLIEQELGRPLSPEEQTAAQALCTALEGHPLRLLQVAARARKDSRSLTAIAAQVRSATDVDNSIAQGLVARPDQERRLLTVLAALGGASLSMEHLSALAQLSQPESALSDLQQRCLVQKEGDHYSLNSHAAGVIRRSWELTPQAKQLQAYLTTWCTKQRGDPALLMEESGAILAILSEAVAHGRWGEVLPLAQAVDGALALARRWGAWDQVLQWGQQAAQAVGDQVAEAWALHQIGTRALALEDKATARSALSQALKLRQGLGDQVGAALTGHNLEIVLTAPPPVATSQTTARGPSGIASTSDHGPSFAGPTSAREPSVARSASARDSSSAPSTKPGASRMLLWAVGAVAVVVLTLGVMSVAGQRTSGGRGAPTATSVPAVQLASISIDPTRVQSFQPSTVTVTLSEPAPPGGTVISLSSGDPNVVWVPARVAISPGKVSVSFHLETAGKSKDTDVEIRASTGGMEQSATVTVAAVSLGTPAPARPRTGPGTVVATATPASTSTPAPTGMPAGQGRLGLTGTPTPVGQAIATSTSAADRQNATAATPTVSRQTIVAGTATAATPTVSRQTIVAGTATATSQIVATGTPGTNRQTPPPNTPAATATPVPTQTPVPTRTPLPSPH